MRRLRQSPGRIRLLRDGPLACLVLDNPGARNALTTAMYEELPDACCGLAADPSVRLVVIRGQGKAFAAGTDIADLLAVRTGADGVAYEGMITRVLNAVRALDVPVVGLVDGPAVGGGLAILACCDLVYATPRGAVRSTGGPDARQLRLPEHHRSAAGRAGSGAGHGVAAHRPADQRGGGARRRVSSARWSSPLTSTASFRTWCTRCRVAPRCR